MCHVNTIFSKKEWADIYIKQATNLPVAVLNEIRSGTYVNDI